MAEFGNLAQTIIFDTGYSKKTSHRSKNMHAGAT